MKYFLPKSNVLCVIQIYLYSLKIKINTSVCSTAICSYRVCLHNEDMKIENVVRTFSIQETCVFLQVADGAKVLQEAIAKPRSRVSHFVDSQFSYALWPQNVRPYGPWNYVFGEKGGRNLPTLPQFLLVQLIHTVLKICTSSYGNRAYRYPHTRAQSILQGYYLQHFSNSIKRNNLKVHQ